jgi:hypothetical protein
MGVAHPGGYTCIACSRAPIVRRAAVDGGRGSIIIHEEQTLQTDTTAVSIQRTGRTLCSESCLESCLESARISCRGPRRSTQSHAATTTRLTTFDR